MVCTAADLLGWKDFPKGLKVLLLHGDDASAAETRSKLEEMDYIVSTFSNEAEALSTISNDSECFHVAIVEVSTKNGDGVIKFLENVKDLPTVLVSNIDCLTTMMKCLKLGAVEFLQKPLSDDKLRNIWQHVVRKAFKAGDKDVTESFKPVNESVASLMHLQLGSSEEENQASVKSDTSTTEHENMDILSESDKYPGPCTPQLKHREQANSSGEQDGDYKSVEITSINCISQPTDLSSPVPGGDGINEENEPSLGSRSEIEASCSENKDPPNYGAGCDADPKGPPALQDSSGTRSSKQKMKVDWTPKLHEKFVQAVEKLGVDQAIPTRILELMKVDGLTRHNVASHLQKYRLHRRHILPKEDACRWPHLADSARGYYPQKPVMAFPPYYPHHHLPMSQVHPTLIPPGNYSTGIPMWGSPYSPAWQLPLKSWQWNPYPGMHAEVWGCPVIPLSPHGSYQPAPQHAADCFSGGQNPYGGTTLVNLSDLHPAEDEIDKVVTEAISKPWLPLPLGLKPPSTDSVLKELSKQGISTISPYSIA